MKSPVEIGDVSKAVPTGFVISVPPDWEEVDPAQPFQDARNFLPSGSPIASPTKAPAPSDKQLTLIARAPALSHGQGLATSVVITKQHYPGGDLTTDEMTRSMQLYRAKTLNAFLVLSKHIAIKELDFAYLEMKYDAQLPRLGTRETYSTVQYIYVKDREVYIIEFTALLDRTRELLPLFESIAMTFEIL